MFNFQLLFEYADQVLLMKENFIKPTHEDKAKIKVSNAKLEACIKLAKQCNADNNITEDMIDKLGFTIKENIFVKNIDY
jgi:hypothetical protein